MKLNQRDKIVLIGILVVLIWVAGIMSFIKPAIESVKSASNTRDSKKMELNTLQQQIEDDKNLPQDVDDAYEAANNIADVFYEKMQQYAAMTEVQQQFDLETNKEGQEIQNLNLSITEMSAADLQRYTYTASEDTTELDNIVDGATGEETVAVSAVADVVEVSEYSMEFNFECTKGDLLTFLENLQSNTHKSLVVSSLVINDVKENEDDTEIEGSMSLDFMMLPRLKDPDEVKNGDSTEAVDVVEDTEASDS